MVLGTLLKIVVTVRMVRMMMMLLLNQAKWMLV